MATKEKTAITVSTVVNGSLDKVWEAWTEPKHIVHWNQASDDWHTPWAKNDLQLGKGFLVRMEAKDRSTGFEFGGVYDEIIQNKLIRYTMDDGRKVKITFTVLGSGIQIIEEFEAESANPLEMQRNGWQAILDSFKKYTESLA